jgi:Ca2+-binding RTX toxin-like protein
MSDSDPLHLPQAKDDCLILFASDEVAGAFRLDPLQLLANDQGGNAKHLVSVDGQFVSLTGDGAIRVDDNAFAATGTYDFAYTIQMGNGARSTGMAELHLRNDLNLIVNGSFEAPNEGAVQASFQVPEAAVPGWTNQGGPDIELWSNGFDGVTPADGHQVAELDVASGVDTLTQTVDAVEGVKYALKFSLAARPDAPLSTSTVQVFWNGTLVDSIHALGGGFVNYIRDVTGAAGPDTLTFREIPAENDGLGSLVDQVSLTAFDWSNAVEGFDCEPTDTHPGDDHREIDGSDRDDNIVCGFGDHVLRGGLGDDTILGGPGFDDINGNQGNDTLSGGAGGDWVVGGKDNDSLSGGAGDDIVWGNLGADTCDGGDGADQVRGGRGDDSLSGGAGADFLSGDRGDDTVSGGAGADIFHGSQDAGIDRVIDFDLAEGDRVQLDRGTTFTLMQVGSDTVLDMGGGNQMILAGVQASTLTPGWVVFG